MPLSKGFSRGSEADAGVVQLLEDLRQASPRPRQTIDPVDEEHVVALCSRLSEPLLQARTLHPERS